MMYMIRRHELCEYAILILRIIIDYNFEQPLWRFLWWYQFARTSKLGLGVDSLDYILSITRSNPDIVLSL